MTMNRAKFRKELQEGLNTVFGLEYKRYPEEWRQLFDVENSNKAYEEDVLVAGLAAARVKPEGGAVTYDEGAEAWVARYNHNTVALAFAITEEAEEDNLYGALGSKYAKALARSMQHTKEVFGANVYNNAFATITGGDGKTLLATDHPLWGGGTLSNKLATPADLSETSLENAIIQIGLWTDERGIPIALDAERLCISVNDQFNAVRILKSAQRVGTADNDTNAMKYMGMLQNEPAVNHRFTDTDAWFIRTNANDGLKHFVRKSLSRGTEGDWETGNMRYKARERYSFGWTDWRGLFGSEGA